MKMETELCAVTLNCWGIRGISKDRVVRMNAIADKLSTGEYDFVFLQEVWTNEDYERIKNRTQDVLPYSYYFYSGVIGAGICILSKAEIKGAFFHQWAVNGYIHKIQHGDWFGGKGIGMVEVVYKGLQINLYTAHLHAEYDRLNDEYLAHRVIQAFDTAQFIKMTSKHADVVIVGGDLNTEPEDLAYKVIIHTAQLKDALHGIEGPCLMDRLHTNETPFNSYTNRANLKAYPQGKRIDYICYSSRADVDVKSVSCDVAWPDRVPNENFSYSDHEAVVARLKVMKPVDTYVEKPDSDKQLKTEIITESIRVCTAALDHLKTAKKMYGILSIVSLCLLIATSSFETAGAFCLVVPIMRAILLLVLVFAIIMGTVWNKMEVHGVLSGLLAMKLEIGRSGDFNFSEYEQLGDANRLINHSFPEEGVAS